MKVLKIVFISFLVIVVIFAGVAYFWLKSFDINKYKPQVEAELARQLGRPVSIGALYLELSFSSGVTLAVDRVSVEDDKEVFANDLLLNIEKIKLNVDIANFLKKKQLVVTEVSINNPSLYIVRTKDGIINWQEIAKKEEPSSSAQPASASAAGNNPSSSSVAIPDLTVRNIVLNQGVVYFRDDSFASPLNVSLERVVFTINNFRLNEPVDFALTARLLSSSDNITVKGRMQVDMPSQAVSLSQVSFNTNLADIQVESLNALLKVFAADYLVGPLAGGLKADLSSLKASAAGIESLNASANLIDGKMKLNFFEFPLENIDMQLTADAKDIFIHQLYLYLASGKVDMKGKVSNYMSVPAIKLDGHLEGLKVQELLPKDLASLNIEGSVDSTFHLDVLDAVRFLPSATSEGTVNLSDGVIKDMNILKLVLEKISIIPNLYESVLANLPPKYKETLAKSDTVIQKLNSQWKLAGEKVDFSSRLEAEGFISDVAGQLDMLMDASIQTTLSVEKELSQSMVSSVSPLGGLLNEQEELGFPLMPYRGPVAGYKPIPDLEYIGKRLIKEQGKEELKKVIFKALEIEPANPQNPAGADPNAPSPSGEPQPNPEAQEQRPEEVIINNVLDMIFK